MHTHKDHTNTRNHPAMKDLTFSAVKLLVLWWPPKIHYRKGGNRNKSKDHYPKGSPETFIAAFSLVYLHTIRPVFHGRLTPHHCGVKETLSSKAISYTFRIPAGRHADSADSDLVKMCEHSILLLPARPKAKLHLYFVCHGTSE